MLRSLVLFVLLSILATMVVSQQINLFSDDNEYLGCYTCSQYEPDAICNEYGTYGSSYSGNSIWNEYGSYGSEYSSYSPWNSYSSSGPKMVDNEGNFYGRFSINTYAGFSQSSELNQLYNRVNGDLEVLRRFLCDS